MTNTYINRNKSNKIIVCQEPVFEIVQVFLCVRIYIPAAGTEVAKYQIHDMELQ